MRPSTPSRDGVRRYRALIDGLTRWLAALEQLAASPESATIMAAVVGLLVGLSFIGCGLSALESTIDPRVCGLLLAIGAGIGIGSGLRLRSAWRALVQPRRMVVR